MENKVSVSFMGLGLAAILMAACGTKPEPQPEPIVEQYVVNMPGENLSALSKVTEGEYKCDYPFGGDNSRNLFFAVHSKGGQYSNIYKKDDTFSASMMQKTSGNNQNMAPAYCQATNQLAFAGKFGSNGARDIYMVSASQGSALTQVTNTPDAEENYPCLSNDGQRLVYEKRSVYSKLTETEIWVKNLQTNENTMLGLGRMPSFSPDGRSIVYIKYTADGWNTCIWTMSADGGNQVQVTESGLGVVWRPHFSPDGRRIVFQCSKQQKRDFDLYVIDINGNHLTQLTINNSYDGEPYWTSDNYIYFASDRGGRDGHYQIWRFKLSPELTTSAGPAYGNSSRQTTPSAGTYHTVGRDESIAQVAQRYGITVRDIVKWNRLQTMTITPGQRLRVSAP